MVRSRKRVTQSYPARAAQLPLYTDEQLRERQREHQHDVRENPNPYDMKRPLASSRRHPKALECGCTLYVQREDLELDVACPVHAARKVGGS